MAPSEQVRTQAERRLVERGLRPTPRRVQVLAELIREHNDSTAQGLHERIRAGGNPIGLATVYRTLAVLVDRGIVDALNHRQGEVCYRLCGDAHHHHLVCTNCHRVVELSDCDLEGWLDRVAAEHGFVATEHQLEVAGVCGDCRLAMA